METHTFNSSRDTTHFIFLLLQPNTSYLTFPSCKQKTYLRPSIRTVRPTAHHHYHPYSLSTTKICKNGNAEKGRGVVRSGESGVSLFLFLRPLFFLPFSVFRFSFVSFLPFVVGGLQFGGIHILLTNGPQQRDRDATGGRVCGLRFFFFFAYFSSVCGLRLTSA